MKFKLPVRSALLAIAINVVKVYHSGVHRNHWGQRALVSESENKYPRQG